MSGAYLRVKRDGKWTHLEVEYLTPQERLEHFQHRPQEELVRWMDLLCETIAAVEKQSWELEGTHP